MRLRKLLPLLVSLSGLAAVVARAQETARPLNPPAPLASASRASAASAGASVLTVASAQRAQELGLPSVAAEAYRQLLDGPVATGADRVALTLALATALLDDGRATEADKCCRGSWFAEQRVASARGARGGAAEKDRCGETGTRGVRVDELAKSDVAWFIFCKGNVRPTAGADVTKSNDAYHKAEAAATNDIARIRFQLAEELVRLAQGNPGEAVLKATHATPGPPRHGGGLSNRTQLCGDAR